MKPIAPAERTRNIHYAIRELAALAAKIPGEVDYFNIGDPVKPGYDFKTPQHMIDAVCKAMREGKNSYPPSLGLPEAINAIRRDAEQKGIKRIHNIITSSGASEAIELALTALVNPGENVLMPLPSYPLYPAVMHKIGGIINPYYLDEEKGWQPDVAEMEKNVNGKTRAVVVINPDNPTGSVAEKKTLKALLNFAGQHNLIVFTDEIYDKMIYSGVEQTALASLDTEVPIVTFNGLAKNYLAPGWRVGWYIISGDEDTIGAYDGAVSKLARARLCANQPMQWAVPAALDGPQDHLADTVKKLEERAAYVKKRCDEIPKLSITPPKAAFYAFPSVAVDDDERFVKDFLTKEKALVVNGSGFGQKPGTSHVRIVFLPPITMLESLFDRLERFLA